MRLEDVARVELGAKNEDVSVRLDGKPSVGLVIFQLPDANALDVADRIHAEDGRAGEELSRRADLRDPVRHHAVHARVHQRGVQVAARRDHPGGLRGAAVPAELALGRSSR